MVLREIQRTHNLLHDKARYSSHKVKLNHCSALIMDCNNWANRKLRWTRSKAGLRWIKQTSYVIFNLGCFHKKCRRRYCEHWFMNQMSEKAAPGSHFPNPPPSPTTSWPGLVLPTWNWGCRTGAHHCMDLGQDPQPHQPHSAPPLARALVPSLHQGPRLWWEWGVRVLPALPWCMHRVLFCFQSCGFIPSGLLFAF